MASSSAEKQSAAPSTLGLDLCVCNNSGHSRGVKKTMNLFIYVCCFTELYPESLPIQRRMYSYAIVLC